MKKFRFLIPIIIMMLLAGIMATQAYAKDGLVIVEDHPNPGVVKLFGGITSVFYAENTCAEKCRFNQTITNAAYKELDQVPKPYLTGVYTRTKDGTGAYTVCFDVRLVKNPAVYRFVLGYWVLVTDTVVNDTLCASGDGDGVIGLFGVVTEKEGVPIFPTSTPSPLPDQVAE